MYLCLLANGGGSKRSDCDQSACILGIFDSSDCTPDDRGSGDAQNYQSPGRRLETWPIMMTVLAATMVGCRMSIPAMVETSSIDQWKGRSSDSFSELVSYTRSRFGQEGRLRTDDNAWRPRGTGVLSKDQVLVQLTPPNDLQAAENTHDDSLLSHCFEHATAARLARSAPSAVEH